MDLNNKRKVLLGLFIVVCMGVLWVIKESPRLVQGDIGGIKIGQGWDDYFFIRGDELTCSTDPQTQQVNCQTLLEGKMLNTQLTLNTPNCEVEYNGETKSCSTFLAIFNTSRWGIFIEDDLGISREQMATYRSQHPFLYYPESTWHSAALVMVVLITILATLFFWNSGSRKQSKYMVLRYLQWGAVSAVLLGVLWFSSLLGLMALGYVD